MQSQLQTQLSNMQAQLLALQASPPTSTPPPASAASTPLVSTIPSPHRVGPLGVLPEAQEEMDALLDRAVRGDRIRSEVSDQNTTPPHTRTSTSVTSPPFNPLPDVFVPLVAGSIEDNKHILNSLIATFHKKESKYTTLDQLDTALGKWLKGVSVDDRWTGKMILSLVQYRRFVIETMGKQAIFSAVLKYHTLWTEAVSDKTHNMFAQDGHIYTAALIEAGLWAIPQSSSSPPSKQGKRQHSTSTSTERKEGETTKKVHPAGSCTNHPASTTHTTAQCQKK
jgi:hypothetical protein